MQEVTTPITTTSFNVLNMTAEAINAIALDEAGQVGRLAANELPESLEGKTRFGFGFKWIGTQENVPGRGCLVLTGLTPSAKRYLVSGRVNSIAKHAGITVDEARRYMSATRDIRYACDVSVVRLWAKNRDAMAWNFFDSAPNKAAWAKQWDVELDGMQIKQALKYLYTVAEIQKAFGSPAMPLADIDDPVKEEQSSEPAKVLGAAELSKLNFGHLAAKSQKARKPVTA